MTSEVDLDIVEVKNRVTSENDVDFFLSLEMGDTSEANFNQPDL